MTPKEDTANKTFSKAKDKLFRFDYGKPSQIKVKNFKWLATNEGKNDIRDYPNNDKDDSAKQVSNNKNKPQNS